MCRAILLPRRGDRAGTGVLLTGRHLHQRVNNADASGMNRKPGTLLSGLALAIGCIYVTYYYFILEGDEPGTFLDDGLAWILSVGIIGGLGLAWEGFVSLSRPKGRAGGTRRAQPPPNPSPEPPTRQAPAKRPDIELSAAFVAHATAAVARERDGLFDPWEPLTEGFVQDLRRYLVGGRDKARGRQLAHPSVEDWPPQVVPMSARDSKDVVCVVEGCLDRKARRASVCRLHLIDRLEVEGGSPLGRTEVDQMRLSVRYLTDLVIGGLPPHVRDSTGPNVSLSLCVVMPFDLPWQLGQHTLDLLGASLMDHPPFGGRYALAAPRVPLAVPGASVMLLMEIDVPAKPAEYLMPRLGSLLRDAIYEVCGPDSRMLFTPEPLAD